MSCASAGNCAAGGYYTTDSAGHFQAFVVSETSGTWHKAIEVAAGLNTDGFAEVQSVSCGAAGNCAAGGSYTPRGFTAAFVVNETSGTWHKAVKVPGAHNKFGTAEVNSVSCVSAGNCAAGGDYAGDVQLAFVIDEVNGVWGRAKEVTGTSGLIDGPQAATTAVSCASAGNCAAGGYYSIDDEGDGHAFIVTETNGVWGKAKEVAAALDTRDGGVVQSVSCGAAGNCSAIGDYFNKTGSHWFIINEVNGLWGKTKDVAAALALNGAGLSAVSCASARNCSAGGYYADSSGHIQAFVVNKA